MTVTNLVPNQAGQKQSCSSQGSELTLKQTIVGRGCFLGMQGGMMVPGFLPSWVPGVGRGRGRPWEEQLDSSVMINFSKRPKVKVTPISVHYPNAQRFTLRENFNGFQEAS